VRNFVQQSKRQRFTKSFLKRSEIQSVVKSAKDELRDICSNLLSGKITFSYGSKICQGVPLDFHRCLTEWSQSSSIDLAIRNIILSAFYSTEVNQGGSGLIACLLWTKLIDPNNIPLSRKDYITAQNVDQILETWSQGGLSCSVVKKLMRLGSCGYPVDLKEASGFGTKVTCIRGQEIVGSVDPLFDSKVNFERMDDDFYILAVDGIVESLGQIHRFLTQAGQQKLMILARGFLPDVSNTMATNWASAKLFAVPFVVTDWGVDNFLNLSQEGFECISIEAGQSMTSAKIKQQVAVSIFKKSIVYQSCSNVSKTNLSVSFGTDLGTLKGISIDRTKTLLALSRFAARSGYATLFEGDHPLVVPQSSLETASRAEKSLTTILQNLGGVITS